MVDHLSPYLFRKRGIYYFSRRVPKDLLDHYERSKIVFSLRTKSCRAAKIKAASLASQLEEDWLTLRWQDRGPLSARLAVFIYEKSEDTG